MDLIHTFNLSTTNERLYLACLFEKGAESLRKPVLADVSLVGVVTDDQQSSEFYDVVHALEAISERKAKQRQLKPC